MPVDYSAKYSIKEIESTSDRAYVGAISIYASHTLPALRTDTNEIGHWLNHYNKTFDDHFHILAFYVNRDLAGFCELVYLKEINIIVIDYITIDEKYRGGLNVFFEFAEHVKAFIRRNHPTFDYIAVEVAPLKDDAEARYGLTLMRLLKMLGFGVVDATYIQPQLGQTNLESELQGALLLYPKPINGSLPRGGYLKLVHSIYYQHYVRWYGVHGEKYQSEYKSSVDRLYRKIEAQVKRESVVVNGLRHFPEKSSPVNIKEKSLPIKELLFPITLILTWLATFLTLRAIFKISVPLMALSLLLVTFLYLALASVSDKRATPALKELSKVFKGIFGKAK
ncbi:MAG: hypothetical protein RSP_10040 [Rhodanobacter sp.]